MSASTPVPYMISLGRGAVGVESRGVGPLPIKVILSSNW